MKNEPDPSLYICLNDYAGLLGITRIDRIKIHDWFIAACNYIKTDVKEDPYYSYRGKGGGTYIHWFLACYILLNQSPNSLYRLLDVEINANCGVDRFKRMLKFHESIERKVYTKNWVYVIKNKSGNFKIGISNDPDRRLKDLQCGNPEKLSIAWKYYTFNAEEVERSTHRAFHSYRLSGEWFDGSKIKFEHLKEYIQNGCNLNDDIIGMCKYPERRYLESDIKIES